MNYRDYKQIAEDATHHIVNHAIADQLLYRDSTDYNQFLLRMQILLGKIPPEQIGVLYDTKRISLKPFAEGAFKMQAYCLMPNHFHLLITQSGEQTTSLFMSKLSQSYTRYFNARYSLPHRPRRGPICEDQYKAVLVSSQQQVDASSAYIHNNPEAAGISGSLSWSYSSYGEYCGSSSRALCDKTLVMANFRSGVEYRHFVNDRLEQQRLRTELGNEIFID